MFSYKISAVVFAVAIVLLSLCCFSCTAPKYVYSPATANLLSITNKGDKKLAVNYSTAGNAFLFGSPNTRSNGGDLQAAAAVGKRMDLRASAYIKSEHNQTLLEDTLNVPYESNNYHKRGAELAVGVYNFSKTKASSIFQLNAGLGFGKSTFTTQENKAGRPLQSFSVDYFKAYLQPAAVIKVSENYRITLANTFSLMRYKNVLSDLQDLKEDALGYIDSKPSIFTEFVVQNEFVFAGLHSIRFQFQFGTSALLTRFSSAAGTELLSGDRYDYHKAWSAFGIIADLGHIFGKSGK